MSTAPKHIEWENPIGSKRLSDWVDPNRHSKYSPYKEDEAYYSERYAGYLDYWADQGKEYRLDPNRDWKTKWVEAGYDSDHGRRDSRSAWFYRPDLYSWHDPARAMGWTEGVHAGTGRYIHDTDKSHAPWYHPAIEMIDYDAYNRDPWYKSGAKGLGLDKVASLQNIYDIEDWYAGAGERNAERQKQADAQLAATNEQISLLKQQLEAARAPRQIDVGQGRTVSEGGVADYFLGLEQQRAKELDALTQSLSSQYGTKLADAEAAWGSRYDQQQADWMSKSATRDREYESRISDLTADWDTQRSAYDTSLSNLNQSITDYQNREQKRLEQAAIESQRARTAAAYARDGRTVNQSVGGVKTTRGLTDPRRNRYGTSFKRADMTIVNKQLNI